MPTYDNIRFIAFNIKPGTKRADQCPECGCTKFAPLPKFPRLCKNCLKDHNGYHDHHDNFGEGYLGNVLNDEDIAVRCAVMKKAIKAAYDEVNHKGFLARVLTLVRGKANNVNGPKTLNVFMAPEFYFRGAEGAYPIDKISTIMEKMVTNGTDAAIYKDWLFVFGTAISYEKKEETVVRITSVKPKPSTSALIVTVDSLLESNWTSAEASEYGEVKDSKAPAADALKGPVLKGPVKVTSHTKGVQSTIKDIQKVKDDLFKVTLDTKEPCPKGCSVFFFRPDYTQTKRFEIMDSVQDADGSTIITISNPDQHQHDTCPECRKNVEEEIKCATFEPKQGLPDVCSKCGQARSSHLYICSTFEPNPDDPYLCRKCKHKRSLHICGRFEQWDKDHPDLCRNCLHKHSSNSANYIRKNQVAKMESVLELDTTAGFHQNNFIRLTSQNKETEIGNYALVSKGGSTLNESGPKHFVIYKEYVSAIDFLGPNFDNELGTWGDADGSGRRINIHREERRVIPSEGSRDVLSEKKNIPGTETTSIDKDGIKRTHRISEINRVGYGGGSVFTIDGITFGLEICLDHAKQRLWSFYNQPGADGKIAAQGEQKVQIHLIPSWGMSITEGHIACMDNGLVFNVDGPASSELRLYDGSYSCKEHPSEVNKNLVDCSKHGYYCTGAKHANMWSAGAGFCTSPDCGLAFRPVYECTSCTALSLSPGSCTKCGSPVAPYPIYKCMDCGQLYFDPGLCPCNNNPVVLFDAHFCDGEHGMEKSPSPKKCPKCHQPMHMIKKKLTKIGRNIEPKGKASISVKDVFENVYGDKKDPGRVTGKKKIDISNYFETDGQIVVYREQKIPKPEIV